MFTVIPADCLKSSCGDLLREYGLPWGGEWAQRDNRRGLIAGADDIEQGIISGSIPGIPAQAILEVMPDNHLRWLKLENRESA